MGRIRICATKAQEKLNNGETYGRGTHFFHASKGDIHEARQPSRYHGNHEAKRV